MIGILPHRLLSRLCTCVALWLLCSSLLTAYAAPRVNVNIGFEQFTDGTTLQQSNFINGSTWSYFDDEACIGGGNPRKCVLGWQSTITPSSNTNRVEVAYASTYGYTNSNRIVAEVNSVAPSRLYYNICLIEGESLNVAYQFAPRSGAGNQQVKVGLWPINSGYPATALSSKNSQIRTFTSTTNPGFTTETATLTAPSAGQYQLGLEAVLPATGSTGNIIDDLTFTLIPLIDLGRTGAFVLKEGNASEATKALRLRINGTVGAGGITVALRRNGSAVDQDIQLGTPTGLVGTTPTISHPSADLWLVYVPAGAYDAGEVKGDTRYGITIPIEAVQDSQLENPESITFSLSDPGVDGSTGSGQWRSANPVCEGATQNTIEYDILPSARVRVGQDNLNTDQRADESYAYHIEIDGKAVAADGQFAYTGSSSQLSDPILLAQGNHTLTFKQSVTGTVPLGRVSPYQVKLVCSNSNTDTTAVVPSETVATTFYIPFTQSKTITLQSLGDGDYISCTFQNRNEANIFLVAGRVFNDNSGTTAIAANAYDGLQQTGELGLAASTLSLEDCSGFSYAKTVSNSEGDYQFVVPRSIRPNATLCVIQTNVTGYDSVSGGVDVPSNRYQYSRVLDRLQWINANTASGASVVNYDQANFGDAWLKLKLTTDGEQSIRPNESASYAHILTSDAVLIPSFIQSNQQQPANSSDAAWVQVLYRDDNCNGVVDSNEPSVAQQPYGQLLPNDKICVVQRINAPSSASNGAYQIAMLTAHYEATLKDGTVLTGDGNTRQDVTTINTGRLEMTKQVRVVSSCAAAPIGMTGFSTSNQANTGDWLEYHIAYVNNGTKTIRELNIRDVLPSQTGYGSAHCQDVPAGASCQLVSAPTANNAAIHFLIQGGGITPSTTGSVRFCVQVL